MNTLIFHNPGEIDIRGACIAGLSAKENKSPIGYFGTGLKYAIACILRWGGEITIYSGLAKYTFRAKELQFRGENFSQIVMDGLQPDCDISVMTPLGFTTEYGKNWEPWQVFRELYANARDEGGGVVNRWTTLDEGEAGKTYVAVTCSSLDEPFYDRDKIILPVNKQWSHQNSNLQFSTTPADGLYYRGVRVHEQPSLYTWNYLTELTLTEDRTLASVYSLSYYFDRFFEEDLHDIDIVMRILQIKYGKEEPKATKLVERDGKATELVQRPLECLLMDWWAMPLQPYDHHSYEFKEACKRLYQRDPTKFSKMRPYIKVLDSRLIEESSYVMTQREQLMFDKGKELVALFGFDEEISVLPIMVQELGGTTLGLYENGSIYLSPKLFDQGTKQLVATLYEECYHHRTQNTDCTYNMQSDLFNIIISLNEELHKVIC